MDQYTTFTCAIVLVHMKHDHDVMIKLIISKIQPRDGANIVKIPITTFSYSFGK